MDGVRGARFLRLTLMPMLRLPDWGSRRENNPSDVCDVRQATGGSSETEPEAKLTGRYGVRRTNGVEGCGIAG
ncbi:hypothetical protein ColKHC_04946 [Colletotrichum higginsianum]|nr:hypothetical protein ColKHC_04946 [Colletotrichum higginsianum]